MHLHITTIAIAYVAITKDERAMPLLWSNSIVGFVYILLEMDALVDSGVVVMGRRAIKKSRAHLSWINMLAHVIAPILLHRAVARVVGTRTMRTLPTWSWALIECVAWSIIDDLPLLYPTRRFSLAYYAVVHALILMIVNERQRQSMNDSADQKKVS